MSINFQVGDKAYYDDGSERERVPCTIMGRSSSGYSTNLVIKIDNTGVIMESPLILLELESKSEELENNKIYFIYENIITLKSEKQKKEKEIHLLEKQLQKVKYDNMIKEIKKREYRECSKDINSLFPTKLFAFGFELESRVSYGIQTTWKGKLTEIDYELIFKMCVFDELFPTLIDLRFLTKLDSKLIEQFDIEEWNSPDLLECLCKQEEKDNSAFYCDIEKKIFS